eukprot:gene2268-4416_t
MFVFSLIRARGYCPSHLSRRILIQSDKNLNIPKNIYQSLNIRKFSGNTGGKLPQSKENVNTTSNSKEQNKKDPAITTAEAIALATKHYTQEINRAYSDMERVLMTRIHESNTRRFRVILLSITVGLFWIIAVFGGHIRKMLTDQTAGLARETLENESLKVQTQELATAVVQTVLNDKEVTSHAAGFLRDASSATETQEALLQLTLHVLQHPSSLQELTALAKKLVAVLASDKETISDLANLLGKALQDPQLLVVVSKLLQDLCKDPEVLSALSHATVHVVQQPEVQKATTELLSASSLLVLEDRQVQDQARDFVTEVMGDDRLQREGGNAIWNSVSHAVTPGLV